MRRVFVVQRTQRLDRLSGRLVDKYDFMAAQRFGELVELLGPSASPFRPDSAVDELLDKLSDFSREDSLLLVGNPVLMAVAYAVARLSCPEVRLLQWSNGGYVEVVVPDLLSRRL